MKMTLRNGIPCWCEQDLEDFLNTIDFEELLRKRDEILRYRKSNPDWARPVVMFGVRKMHKCIKKKEIGVIIDVNPWQERARTAETHWYHILYKRPATDEEWAGVQGLSRRYLVWHYFIDDKPKKKKKGGMGIDHILSIIVKDEQELFNIVNTAPLIHAFEQFYNRPIIIHDITYPQQLVLPM